MRSLRVQFLLSHLALVLLMALITGSAVWSFVQLGHGATDALRDDLRTVRGTARIDAALAQQREVLALLRSGEADLAQAAHDASVREMETGLADLEASVSEGAEEAQAALIGAEAARYRSLFESVYKANLVSYQESTPRSCASGSCPPSSGSGDSPTGCARRTRPRSRATEGRAAARWTQRSGAPSS